MGCGILNTYAQVANISGLHGLIVYTICGALPIMSFGFFAPLIRKRCPEGFILTEWVRQRFGLVAAMYLSAFTLLTMFLYMIAELSAIKLIIETLTGLDALAPVIVEVVVTSIYTSIGGFRVSFVTDNFQGALVLLLIIVAAAGMGSYVDIDTSKIGPSGLLKANLLGWQLIYIMFVAVGTNAFFLNPFWLRAFASKTNKDLVIGSSIAGVLVFCITTLVGVPGFLAVWAGDIEKNDPNNSNAVFIMLAKMPNWVIGFVLVFAIAISTCTFDSFQSAMVSTISNDIFRNKLHINYIRVMVVLVIIPIIVLAIKVADDILQIYLIADLVSASVIPTIFLGLSDKFFWFLRGFDIMAGGLLALVLVFVFGTVYYHSAEEGAKLLLIWNGLYNSEDWGAFGAFAIAPFGSILVAMISAGLRIAASYIYCAITGKQFTALDRPKPSQPDEVSEEISVQRFEDSGLSKDDDEVGKNIYI